MSWPTFLAAGLVAAGADATVVERVEVVHNRSIPSATLLFYVSTRAGDRYDRLRLGDDYRRLLATGLLDDAVLDVSDGARGRVVVFDVTERPRLRSVEYRGSKALAAKAIEAELKRRDAALAVDSAYDAVRARRGEAVIREMLAGKDRPFASVRSETRDDGPGLVHLLVRIDDGPRARLKEVVFTGNRALAAGDLRGRMKKPEDVERVRELYLERGYVTAEVGPAKVTYLEGEGSKSATKWMRLEVPVREGEQYRVGKLGIEGLTAFGEDEVRSLFGLAAGDVYDESKIRKGYDVLRAMYGKRGYVQWTALTRRSPDPAARTVDVALIMEEDKRYSVGRIRFTGNDVTRDRVARRELFLNEGDVFDTDALKQSVRRLDQLGYFEPLTEPPEVAPDAKNDDALDVTFKVRERNGIRYNFGAGTSDTEGTFLNGSFATANFLGLGETLELDAQAGSLVRDYRLSATEPYLLGRPISAGFEVFNRKLSYRTETTQGVQGYVDRRTGGGVTSGLTLGKWTRFSLGYSYQVVDISLRDAADLAGAGLVSPVYIEDAGRRRESTLRPSLVRNTVDDLFAPRRGTRLSLSLPVTGGPLGGSLDFLKPDLEAVAYVPVGSRTGFGLRGEAGFVLPFGDTARIDSTTGRDQLPFYQRFFLGGETQLRGYDLRSVGPRDASGLVVGGNKFVLWNAEYAVDVVKPLRLLAFFDAGQAFAEGRSLDLGELRTSTGIEARITPPFLKVPFRFIWAWNPNRDPQQPPHAFKFAIGTTF